jgi:hypothetical protein
MHYPTPLGPYPIGDAKAHSRSIQRCLQFEPQLLLEGHGLSAYSQPSSQRRLLHMQMQQRDTHERVLACLVRAGKPLTISQLLPEVMPIKTELDYAVSTGVGERRCYAEACIQTHLLWLVEQGKVQRVSERKKICFVAVAR